ncbi:MAG: NAD-dependent DNA ligase LigA [bacterium]
MKEQKPIAEMSVAELEKAVRHHNELYFKLAKPEISDYEFDRMVERLKKLKPNSPVLEEIGSDLSEAPGKKVEHSSPMLSLDKCYSDEDLLAWAKKLHGDVVASPKIDGLAIAIHYDAGGRLRLSETRGDGVKGDDITRNVQEVGDVPRKIAGANLEVRGEVYMRKSVFQKYQGSFANPRNLAAGALKQKDPKKTREYDLNFFAYELIGLDLPHEMDKLQRLKKLGFEVIASKRVANEPEALTKVHEQFLQTRGELDYELDGVVYKANDVADQTRLGASSHHPRWAIAYKFQGDSGKTVLREVEWSVSRTGVITPIGIIDPVRLSGATVSRVSLHNYGLMKKMGVSIGAKVLVMRRGGVIPNLEEVLEKTKHLVEAPKTCPSCGAKTEIRDDFLYCTNEKGCRSTRLGELRHFVDVLEIEGFGDKTIEQLYDNGYVEDLPDFFRLTKDDLLNLERMGEILASKLIDNIQSRRRVPLALFLRSLGIPELAKHSSEVLVKQFRSLERIRQATEEELGEIHTIGPVIAREVVKGLKEKGRTIDKLLKYVSLDERGAAKTGKLSGKSFLFTGRLAAMERGEVEKRVEALGGEIAAGVSKELDYLVIGSEGYKNREKGNKWIKAEALIQKGADLKILSEEEFLRMLE